MVINCLGCASDDLFRDVIDREYAPPSCGKDRKSFLPRNRAEFLRLRIHRSGAWKNKRKITCRRLRRCCGGPSALPYARTLPEQRSFFGIRNSLKHSGNSVYYAVQESGEGAVQYDGTGDREDFCPDAEYKALCLCQVNPKRFFYFPVEIRQEFFFPYYEASPGIHSPIISVRYLLFSPISIRPPSNTRTLSISRLITSGRYSVKA